MYSWSPTSWQEYPYLQAPTYKNKAHLDQVTTQLSELPPLVSSNEIQRLRKEIAAAGRGESFILQGGDCAESFAECRSEVISSKLKILLQMSLVLVHGLGIPVIRIGRIAGQYAKPRSADFETINGVNLPSYRGDIINSAEFTEEARRPNPELLLQAYSCSAMSLNFIRSLLTGGFADLHELKDWDLAFAQNSPPKKEYQSIVESIEHSLHFLHAIDGVQTRTLNTVDFYTSHEALHLHYEQALTRQMNNGLWYNLSTHLPWIGIRTGQLDSAHVELLRGVENPIGIKIGHQSSPEWLTKLLHILNPNKEAGRIILFTRLGADHVFPVLPSLIQAVRKSEIPVTWSCDPMHGNTELTATGIKTRHFDTILQELKLTLEVHRTMKSHLGGVHFELTGDNVTECIGGSGGLVAEDLSKAYHSLVDPRLNYEQSLEMAIQLSKQFRAVTTRADICMASPKSRVDTLRLIPPYTR